jgi:hypothetical protein
MPAASWLRARERREFARAALRRRDGPRRTQRGVIVLSPRGIDRDHVGEK